MASPDSASMSSSPKILCQALTSADVEESDMEIVRLPISAFEQKLKNGEIRDVCTLAAWAGYLLWAPNAYALSPGRLVLKGETVSRSSQFSNLIDRRTR